MFVMIDGDVVTGPLPIPYSDQGLQRGDGCFEFVRLYGGRYFALAEHLDRLERSAAMLGLDLPPREVLNGWFADAAKAALGSVGQDCGVRLLVSRSEPDSSQVRCILAIDLLPPPKSWRMTVMKAPWQPAGRPWELEGAKTLSYAPNMSSARLAGLDGFDDAILVDERGVVLECPRAAIAWVIGSVIETPGLELGILDSITRRHVLQAAREAGYRVIEGSFHVDRLRSATELMGLSSAKEVAPVIAVDEREYPEGPVTKELSRAFGERVSSFLL